VREISRSQAAGVEQDLSLLLASEAKVVVRDRKFANEL
jgi:hypothetical protein